MTTARLHGLSYIYKDFFLPLCRRPIAKGERSDAAGETEA